VVVASDNWQTHGLCRNYGVKEEETATRNFTVAKSTSMLQTFCFDASNCVCLLCYNEGAPTDTT